MLGFRKTAGSQEEIFPSAKNLIESCNKLNTILGQEEIKRLKNAPKLTVGGRAL